MSETIKVLFDGVGGAVVLALIGWALKRRHDLKVKAQEPAVAPASNASTRETQDKVHDRQVDVLTRLCLHLAQAQSYLQAMGSSFIFEGEKPERYLGLFQQALVGPQDELTKGRLLIPPALLVQVDDYLKELMEGLNELSFAKRPEIQNGEQRARFWDRGKAIAYVAAPALLRAIEADARQIIGSAAPVTDKPETPEERKVRRILAEKGKTVTLSQMNTGKAAKLLGSVGAQSEVALHDCTELYVTIGSGGPPRSIPLSRIDVSFDNNRQRLELQEGSA